MPRRNRAFTGADIARLYCKNLPQQQKPVAIALMDECLGPGDGTDVFLAAVIRAVADGIDAAGIPAASFLSSLLGIIADAVERGYTEEEVRSYLLGGVSPASG